MKKVPNPDPAGQKSRIRSDPHLCFFLLKPFFVFTGWKEHINAVLGQEFHPTDSHQHPGIDILLH